MFCVSFPQVLMLLRNNNLAILFRFRRLQIPRHLSPASNTCKDTASLRFENHVGQPEKGDGHDAQSCKRITDPETVAKFLLSRFRDLSAIQAGSEENVAVSE